MPLVSVNDWTPVGVDSLEDAAETVVRSDQNALVVAGPGAGKTELLAQRACFLLETGLCPSPRRILAISFKRDAAKNLRARVEKRSGERARRFDSFTLDGFAKGLVDRFSGALPEEWRPPPDYEVQTKPLRVQDKRDWLWNAGAPKGTKPLDFPGLGNDDVARLFDRICHGIPIPYDGDAASPLERHLGLRWWSEQLRKPSDQPGLTFPMLSRLAAHLVKNNPKLRAALRATYWYVFLDEFQDTTQAQYDLVHTAFADERTIITAVGDEKQRIMLWAGAKPDVFDAFESDFNAKRHHLVSNFRSAPELVEMQHVIAKTLEKGVAPSTASGTATEGTCVVWEFRNEENEANCLAGFIRKDMLQYQRNPRDYCIIVRQQTGQIVGPFKDALGAWDIRLRDESTLQDLLTEPVADFVLSALRLGTRNRDPEAWGELRNLVGILLRLDEEEDGAVIDRKAKELLGTVQLVVDSGGDFHSLPSILVKQVGESAFRSNYHQYARGSYLNKVTKDLSAALMAASEGHAVPSEIVDDVIGVNTIPAMTIHKSKGLEFHTVIFLGLEDSQWWNFSKKPDEEKRGFFVAFSRAIQRVIFTYCDSRKGRYGPKRQSRTEINDLYTVLKEAGVTTKDHRTGS